MIEDWPHYQKNEALWQGCQKSVRDRSEKCFERPEMSDIEILSIDDKWSFGATVKNFYGHKFLLGSCSPVLHHILYEMDCEEHGNEIKLNLNPKLNVTLLRTKEYESEKLTLKGIPPIAIEALLEYIYKDKFTNSNFENGYNRNLLWRIWHASQSLEMDHLAQMASETIHKTMSEETVFWDLNYSINFNEMKLDNIKNEVLKIMHGMGNKLFQHPNFVWIEETGIKEILNNRRPGSTEPVIILNNLLRWSLYQMDRLACCEVDNKTGSDIPIESRLKWIEDCQNGKYPQIKDEDLEKYLKKGTEFMPWLEFSQEDFLKYVSTTSFLSNKKLLKTALDLMHVVIDNPKRLKLSEFKCKDSPS